jgi:uncharacterized delta-60 repeat protein
VQGWNPAVIKTTPNGVLDTTFGTAGYATINAGGGITAFRDCAVQADGKIVGVGYTFAMNQILVRFHANGSVDTTFATSGLATLNYAAQNDYGSSLLIQPDGKIITVGCTQAAGVDYVLIARYLSNGTLDTSFGSSGTVITNFGIVGATFYAPDPYCTVSAAQRANGSIVIMAYNLAANRQIIAQYK